MPCSNILRTYHPFIGSTTDPNAPTPPPLTPPTITPATEITFVCASPAMTLTIRSPRLGDKDEITHTRISRETRGGLLLIFKSSDWPEIEKLTMEFEGLTKAKAEEAFYFNQQTAGKQITLTDWEGNSWTGTMMTSNMVKNKDNCGVSLTIEFEGSRV